MHRSVLTAAVAVIGLGLTAGTAFAEGDVAAGEKVYKKCKACHTVDKDGKNKVGPNLWGIVGKDAAQAEFKYSKAMKGAGIVWSEDVLDAYLAAPRKYVKGTKMAFAGLKKEKDRADVIAYLKTLAD